MTRGRPVATLSLSVLLAAGAILGALVLGAPLPAGAQDPDSEPSGPKAGEERAAPPVDEGPKLDLGASVDAFFSWNRNRPADHASFFPGVGTSAKRANEASINLAQLDVGLAPKPVGFRLSLGFGTAAEVVHGAEPSGTAAGSEIWKNVLQASAQWQTGLGRGLLLEAGVYPSHIGFETLAPKDNWNYTRSWLGELSPYYQTGLKLAYPFSARWSAQLHLLNGWQLIADNNRGKSVGAQVAYGGERLTVSLNGLVGPELPDDDDDLRALIDLVATWKASPSLSLAGSLDLAREERPSGPAASWSGIGLWGRYAPPRSRTAVALRAERFDDDEGAISGTPQELHEVTLTLEHRPGPHLLFRLEGRYDRSTADVFATSERSSDGSPVRTREQLLLVLAVVASF